MVVLPLVFISLLTIIPWEKSVEIISANEEIAHNKGITSSHFGSGGIDQIMIPLQVSLLIAEVLRLSMATFQVQRVLIWSWISVLSV